MNNDVYNNKGTSSLDEAYARLNEAIKKRNASSTNQQYDNTNGVALNTTPLQVNNEVAQPQVESDADWFTRTYATGLQAYQNVQRGLLNTFEGAIDFVLQLVGIFDADLAEKMISYDITDTLIQTFDFDSKIYKAVTGKELQDQSWLYEADKKIQDTIISVEQGVGNAIGMMGIGALTGGSGLATYGVISASAGGQTVEGVFQDSEYSGNFLGAVGYGIASGAVEGAIEYASMGVGNALNKVASKTGIKALENTAGVFTGSYAGKNLGGKVVSYLVSAVSEGGEEVLSEVADPFIKVLYSGDTVSESWKNNFSKEQLDNAFLVGTLSSMLINGGTIIETTREATKYGVDRYGNLNSEAIEEAAQIKEEMEYMSRNQGQYSQNQYNEMMTQYTNRLNELYRDIESTNNAKALGRAEQFMQNAQINRETLQSEEFSKKIEFHTETQERIDEFKQMIDKANNNVDFNEQFDVTFEASEEPLTDPDGRPVDAMYNENTKKITFSSTISPTKAFNFLASHELKHHFDTIAELREVNAKILDKIKTSGNYETKKAKLIKLGYKEKEADGELVADYIGKLFKSGEDFDFLTMTKEQADLAAQKLAGVRKETSDKYIRARYAEAIAKLRNAETYREPAKAVAYNKAEVKYSKAETTYKELPAEKATAELKEGKVFNRNVGEVIYDVLSKEFETNHFRFDISKEDVLKEVSKLLNLNDVESVEFNEKLEKFSKDLVKTLKIGEIIEPQVLDEKGNVVTKEKVKYKPILEYFREIDPSTTYSDIYEFVGYDIADALKQVSVFKGRVSQTTRKNLEIKKSKETIEMKQNLLDEVSEILDSKMELIQTLKKNNVKTVKYVSQIERIKTFAKNFEKSKIFKEGSIREFAQTFYNNIKSINVNKANARGIVLSLKDAFESSLIKGEKEIINDVETYPNDVMNQEQRSYLAAVFKLLEARKNLDVPIDFSNNIENLDEFNIDMKSIQNKTEGEVIADVLRIFRKVTNEANNKKAILNGKEVDIHEVLSKEVELQNANKRNTAKAQEGFIKKIKQIITSIFDPQSWFNVLGNNNKDSIFNQIYEDLYKADEKKLEIRYKLQKDVNDYIKNNKSLIKRISNKNNKVEIANGKRIPITHAIDLYMSAQADNAASHLFNKDLGGYKSGTTHILSKDLISMLEQSNQDALNSLNKDTVEEDRVKIYKNCVDDLVGKVRKIIGEDVMELVKKFENGYHDSGKIYSDTAFKKNGFRYTVQDYYYPLTANKDQFNMQTGTLESNNNFVNNVSQPSFTKKITKGAVNEIQLESAIDRYYNFTNRLSSWAALSERVKTIDRFLNSHIETPNGRKQSMREYIKEFIDPDFNRRYNDLVMSMQDIPITPQNPADKFFNKLRGLMASATLSFKAKTILIQPTAYLKFLQYGHIGNFIKAFGRNAGLISFRDLLTKSPLIYDRYNGNQGRNLSEAYTVGASGSLNRFGQWGMEGMSLFDRIGLIWGWRKTQLDAKSMGITNEEEVVKLFERRVNETQASHSSLNNGSATRVNNEAIKGTLIFSSENRKTLSRFFESIYKISKDPKNKQYWGEFAGITTAMVSSSAIIALIASAIKGLKDDEEEEEFIDKWGDEFAANLVGMFPIVSNIYNKLVYGYNIEIAGISQLEDLLDIPKYCEQLMETGATEAQKTSAVMQISQRLAHLMGVPFKNLYDDILILAGLGDAVFDSNMVMKLRNFYYNTDSKTTSTLIKTYSKRNDMEKLSAMIQVRNEKFGAGKTNEKVSNEMARLYNKGVLETFPSQLQSEYTVDGVVHKLNKTQYKQAQDIYSLANEAMELMVVSSQYSGLSDEEKAQAIKKLYGAYYEASKMSVINASEGTKLSKVVKYIDSGKFASYLAKIDGLKASTSTNKKSVVQSYINRLGISKNEKYLLAHLAGYSISDEAKESVSTYLRSKGMAYKDSNEYFK